VHHSTWREALAEFLGTLVLIAFGTAVCAQVTLGEKKFGEYLSINIGWGLAVMAGVFISGGISGGHLNPAVTLAMTLLRGFPTHKALAYIAAQMAGAFVGAAIVFFTYHEALQVFDGDTHSMTTAGIWATYPQEFLTNFPGGFIDQAVGTALLLVVVFAVSDQRNLAFPSTFAPIIVGLTVVLIGMTYGLNAGYAINPARDLAPRLFTYFAGWGSQVFTAHDNWWWVPVVGPCVGAVVGGLFYDLLITRQHETPIDQLH
jgi:MIP family channel proteins